MDWDELLKKLYNPEIRWLECIPPSSVIPALDSFLDAPYKFHKGYSWGKNNEKWLVWYNDEAIIAYNTQTTKAYLFVFTRTSKRIYAMPMPVEWLPKNLSAWRGFSKPLHTMDDYCLVKLHFNLPLTLIGDEIRQGNLVLKEICYVDEERKRKLWLWQKHETDTIYNHKFNNATVHVLPRIFVVETHDGDVEVTSEDHETVKLKSNSWYVAYHPPPQTDD